MMSVRDRIERRLRSTAADGLFRDRSALSPLSYEPAVYARGPVIEEVLDALEPVFSGSVPPTAYVWGPKGAGKSTVVTEVVGQLRRLGGTGDTLYTTTRANQRPVPAVAYVDCRRANTEFAFYQRALAALVGDESVPDHGVSTLDLRARLRKRVRAEPTVVVVDHLGGETCPSGAVVEEWVSATAASLSWVGVGRRRPSNVDVAFESTVEIPAYEPHALVDVLSTRATAGLARGAVSHGHLRSLAESAAGDAHDALAALYAGALAAEADGRTTLTDADVDAGLAAVPEESVSLHRLFALRQNRQELLVHVLETPLEGTETVDDVAESLAARPGVGLERSTITRLLYELADSGIVRRVSCDRPAGSGRPPSRLEPQFPTPVFRELYARNH
ncbi:Cdc6/Cdc18 family protein [Natrononativus amylolyticus]|uniref:Cdc6/Cdc18 family protein n=1 Tax=Natrononativus amylolyticus TaxID=2963434 RepID=UPI0020CD7CAA|nr:AAA family ATPase [Natrononativus amylolyticus]